MLFVKLQRNVTGANSLFLFADDALAYGAIATAYLGKALVRPVRNTSMTQADLQVAIDTLIAAGYNSLPFTSDEATAVLNAVSRAQVCTTLSTDLAAIADFSLCYTLMPSIVS